jgi:hypothetical protein
MRCYFLTNGHIVTVVELEVSSDQEAIEKSEALFAETPQGQFDDFEVWDRARIVYPAGLKRRQS